MGDEPILPRNQLEYNLQILQLIVAYKRTIMDKPLLKQLEDIAVFATVVDQGSFSGAGRRLGLSKSAISKRVDRLETALGLRLLQRSTRSLSMTEAGRAIHEQASQSISLLREARNQAVNLAETPQGLIKVTTSVAFGKLCIAPVLSEFLRLFPAIKVQLVLLDRTVDLVEEGFDLAIRLTRSPLELLVAKPLMPIEHVLCAAPGYIKGKHIKSPTDLANLNCLSYSHQDLTQEWSFQKGSKKETVKVSGNIVVNSSEVVRDLMLENLGIGLVARYAVTHELNNGELRELLPTWKPTGSFSQTAFAVWKPQIHLPQKIRVFVDFLQARLSNQSLQPNHR